MRKRPAASACARIATWLVCLLLPVSAQAQAAAPKPVPAAPVVSEPLESAQPNRGAVAFDALVLRPVGLAVLPIGVALFIPAALTTAPNGREGVKNALDLFVTNPANFVFTRPLGEF